MGSHLAGPQTYQATFVTINATGWRNLQLFISTLGPEVSVVLAQETWLLGSKIPDAQAWCAKRGWRAGFTAAVATDAGSCSAGAAIFVRDLGGLRFLEGMPSFSLVPGRAAAGIVELPGYPAITVVSIYLVAAEKLSQRNLDILATVAAAVEAQAYASVIGGDFNNSPSAIDDTQLPCRASLRVVSTAVPTYYCAAAATTIDYFLVDEALSLCISHLDLGGGVEADSCAAVQGHLPVYLRFQPRPAELRVQKIYAPRKMPIQRIIGPAGRPPQWGIAEQQVLQLLELAHRGASVRLLERLLGEGFRRWAEVAEAELVT